MMNMLQHIIVHKLINSFVCVYTCLVIEATVGEPIIFTSASSTTYSYSPLSG